MNAIFSMFAFRGWEADLAMRYLRTKRKDGGIAVIAIISFVGIALAVTALISVLSIMNGFRDEMMSRVLAFQGHAYVQGTLINDFAHRDDMLKRLKAVPGVIEATPQIDSPGLVQNAEGQTSLAYMRGVVPDDLRHTPIVADTLEKGGSMDQFGVGDYGGDVVLIGDGLASDMGLIPGDQLTLTSPGGSTAFGATPRRKVYTVGGIFKSGVSEIDKSFVYMPIQQAQLFFDREDEWDQVEIKVEKPYDIEKYLPALHQATGRGAVISTWKDLNAPLWGALKVERNAMRFILFFIVIIAMLNIISGIVMLVKNKARDVAILRTMGADRGAISRVFFLTGTSIGAAGTLCGLLVGVLFCTFIREIQDALEWVFHVQLFNKDIYFLDHVPAKMEPSEVIFVVVASLLAASISTFFPALWASKLEPVEALRYE
ncbi:MAG: lipoprotein-releasing ABC transporter permease subunit [Asticcacaulis sp.]|uniref:lipoprotein-releasing ABC transporter permease subunit n=1 Tax=Asticcacaulis sp. TaxID=1872648 RepID=UPI003F7C9519